MTREEKKRYLNSYVELKQRIDSLTEEYHFWEAESKIIPTTNLTNLGIHGNNRTQPLTKHLDICIEIEELIKLANNELINIVGVINTLDNPDHRAVLTYKHINNLYFNQIAERMHYSTRTIFRLYRKAIDALDL